MTVSSQESQIRELESSRSQAVKRLSMLEGTLRDQLTDRNKLLLSMWARLSALCGNDWAHDNSLIDGRALPSLEVVGTMLPGFSKNLLAAVKTIEAMVGGFQTRIKAVERELWKEYQNLENNLEVRTKKLERLESIVRNGVASGNFTRSDGAARLEALEEAYRQLKVENATLRTATDVRARAAYDGSGSPSPSIPTGPREREVSGSRRSRPSTATRAVSRSGSSSNMREVAEAEGGGGREATTMMLRLKEMERKLRAEREGRNQDRSAARQRLGELEGENRELSLRIKRGE